MIGDFVERKLAEVDDLAELKVTLVTLRLLEQKVSPAASVTERELLAHPAIRDGLSFPAISLSPALQRAVARGALLCAQVGEEQRYFAADETSRRTVEALSTLASPDSMATQADAVLGLVAHEIERLELIDAYPISGDDRAQIEEWLARGYTHEEIMAAARLTLRSPRGKHVPPRGIKEIGAALTVAPPAEPSDYYLIVVAKASRPPEEIVNLRERLGRWPTAHEFAVARAAVGLFGLRVVLDALRRVDVDELLGFLAEQEDAALALQRNDAQVKTHMREVVQLYESSFGLPPTGAIANEMQALFKDFPDVMLWRDVFAYAAGQNKRSWPYVRKLLQNPSADVFLPQPANDTARLAFEAYRKRVNRTLDASVANEINQLAQKVTDAAVWSSAFDKAAAANALRWDYIKKVLASSAEPPTRKNHGRAKPTTKRGGTFRRPQVQYTEAERAAAEERARQQLARRTSQPAQAAQPAQSGDKSHCHKPE